jgi:putative transposase
VLDNLKKDKIKKIVNTRYVELVVFALMQNHFHLIVHEFQEGGISQYMQRALNSYTKYFNTKYGKSGHLFQGPYQIIHIKNNEQLLHLSAYAHRNPREIAQWNNKEHLFPWSSYQDYIKENRWGELLKHQIITEQFSSPEDYRNFVETSGTKLQLDKKHFI